MTYRNYNGQIIKLVKRNFWSEGSENIIAEEREEIPPYGKCHQSTENLHYTSMSLLQRLFKGPLKPSGHWTS